MRVTGSAFAPVFTSVTISKDEHVLCIDTVTDDVGRDSWELSAAICHRPTPVWERTQAVTGLD